MVFLIRLAKRNEALQMFAQLYRTPERPGETRETSQRLYGLLIAKFRRKNMKTIDAKTKDLKALNSVLRKSANGTPVKVRKCLPRAWTGSRHETWEDHC